MIKLLEVFDTPKDLIQNPEYNELGLHQILDKFRKEGGTVNSGKSGIVLTYPKWKYVLKIFPVDIPYLKFVRFVLQNPRPSFPKFYDKPRKIIPNYTREEDEPFLYIVKTEKLFPITKEEWEDIKFITYFSSDIDWDDYLNRYPDSEIWKEYYKRYKEIERKYPSIKTFLNDYHFLLNNINEMGVNDLGDTNVMKRKEGEFVLSDPVWKGETPYERYKRLMDLETDAASYEPSIPTIPGGKFKIKKKKPIKHLNYTPEKDDVPF